MRTPSVCTRPSRSARCQSSTSRRISRRGAGRWPCSRPGAGTGPSPDRSAPATLGKGAMRLAQPMSSTARRVGACTRRSCRRHGGLLPVVRRASHVPLGRSSTAGDPHAGPGAGAARRGGGRGRGPPRARRRSQPRRSSLSANGWLDPPGLEGGTRLSATSCRCPRRASRFSTARRQSRLPGPHRGRRARSWEQRTAAETDPAA